MKKIINFFAEQGFNLDKGMSVIDIGCSAGGMLDYLRSAGFRSLVGVETNEASAKYATDNLGLNVYDHDIESLDLKNTFEFIIMRDILEHLLDPVAVLKKVWTLGDSNSLVYIETNNVFCPVDLLSPYEFQFHFVHPFIFSERSLRNLLRISSFECLRLIPGRYIRCIARKCESEKDLVLERDEPRAIMQFVKRWNRFLPIRRMWSRFRTMERRISERFRVR